MSLYHRPFLLTSSSYAAFTADSSLAIKYPATIPHTKPIDTPVSMGRAG